MGVTLRTHGINKTYTIIIFIRDISVLETTWKTSILYEVYTRYDYRIGVIVTWS